MHGEEIPLKKLHVNKSGEKMIIKRPIPLLEASFFLANRASGKSSREFFEEKVRAGSAVNERTKEYEKLILKLEERLENSITADEGVIDTLFKPYTVTHDSRVVSTDFAANLVIQNILNYFDTENCFDALRDSGKINLNNSIYNWISKNTDYLSPKERLVDDRELFDTIKESMLPAEAKLLILDIFMHYDKYVDMLEAAVLPVARAFEKSDDLIQPLLDVYCSQFHDDMDISRYRRDMLDEEKYKLRSADIFPLITYYLHRIVMFENGDDGGRSAKIGVGVLYHFFQENYVSTMDEREKLAVYMNVLGGKNRFNIVARLADGPVYGRELARMLDVAPATVSQHMSLLMAANIVKLENEGSKVYYSLNRDGMRELIELQKHIFLKE